MQLFLVNGFLREPFITWAMTHDHWLLTIVLCLVSLATSTLVALGLAIATRRLMSNVNTETPASLWGMVFPFEAAGPLPRHPSQLYQFALEGVVLFTVLWIYSRKPRPMMAVSGMFLVLYGILRFIVEFFRQPDDHLLFVAFGWMTRGQQLCIPMVLIGLVLIWLAYKRGEMAQTKS